MVMGAGRKIKVWYRTTICYRKIDGKWVVTHEHDSVPFMWRVARPRSTSSGSAGYGAISAPLCYLRRENLYRR
jgi:hypothetical protein